MPDLTIPMLRNSKLHDLKTWPVPFSHLRQGSKTHEIRENDRNFRVHDILLLREWDPMTEQYSGRCIWAEVTYITRGFGYSPERKVLDENAVVMSIRVLAKREGYAPPKGES